MDINKLNILDIQPTQFYISAKKVEDIKKWFNPYDLANFEPVPVLLLNGNIVFTDGHTRAFVAHSMGLLKMPLVWETDALDLIAYEHYAKACQKRKILNISHLSNRILSPDEYTKLWNGWCNTLHSKLNK